MEKIELEMSVLDIRKPDVFRILFRTFFPRACKFAAHLVRNDEAGVDIAQETFLYMWQKTATFPHVEAFKSYMYTTLKNKCLNYFRDRREETNIADVEENIADDTRIEHLVIEQELKARILQEINKLPEMKKEIMLMRLDGKSFDEISKELQLSLNTVKAHKKESYRQLRVGLSDYERFMFMLVMLCGILLS